MNKHFPLALLALLLLLGGCANLKQQAADQNTNTLPGQDRFASVKEAMATYRSGLDLVMASVPEEAPTEQGMVAMLATLRKLVYPNTFWGSIEPDGSMKALSKGHTTGCWVMFYTPDHPALLKNEATLTTSIQSSLVTVAVRPNRMSKKWAGIFLVHELQHALERMYETDIKPETAEYLAYYLEKTAYNRFTKGRFDKVLDDILKQHGIAGHAKLFATLRQDKRRTQAILDAVDAALAEERPLSMAEMEMRYGFYLMSLSIRASERDGLPPARQAENLNQMLKTFSKYPVAAHAS